MRQQIRNEKLFFADYQAKSTRSRDTSRCGTLFLSPHCDDVALSCGHIIEIGLFPQPLTLATVFSKSNHTRYQYTDTNIREQEDICFANMAGFKNYIPLGLEDKSFSRSSRTYNAILESVTTNILKIIDAMDCAFAVASHPNFQYGNIHVHHLLCYQAMLMAVRRRPEVELLWVDDIPYTRMPLNATVTARNIRYVPFLVELNSSELAVKMSLLCQCYRSQQPFRYIDSITMPAEFDPKSRVSETLWMPEHFKITLANPSAAIRKDRNYQVQKSVYN